jgi:hypothetical protein
MDDSKCLQNFWCRTKRAIRFFHWNNYNEVQNSTE